MTETEWLEAISAAVLIGVIGGPDAFQAFTPRKLRLFLCARCRACWHQMPEEKPRALVEVAERFVDRRASMRELELALDEIKFVGSNFAGKSHIETDGPEFLRDTLRWIGAKSLRGFPGIILAPKDPAFTSEAKNDADRMRDIFSPFCSVKLNRSWLAWNGETVKKMAQAIYDDRAFDRMPILADALEDAGCDDAEILGHCRGPGPHARGCWVVDLLLDKK